MTRGLVPCFSPRNHRRNSETRVSFKTVSARGFTPINLCTPTVPQMCRDHSQSHEFLEVFEGPPGPSVRAVVGGKRLIHLGSWRLLGCCEACLTSRRSQVRVLHCPSNLHGPNQWSRGLHFRAKFQGRVLRPVNRWNPCHVQQNANDQPLHQWHNTAENAFKRRDR